MVNRQFRLIDLIDDMCDGKDVFSQFVRNVEDIMTYDVKVLTLDDTIKTCLKMMQENKIRHIPVVDTAAEENEEQHLVGIVSQRDVFRQISPYLGRVGEIDSDSKALKQPLTQIVTRKPETVSPETKIQDMISIMVNNRIDSIPVLLDGKLVGIATSTDVMKLFARADAIGQLCQKKIKKEQGRRFVDLLSGESGHAALALSSVLRTVKDIMTEQVACLTERDNLAKVMKAMQVGVFRHVPIVDKQKRLVGIVSDRDVLHHLPFRDAQRRPQAKMFRNGLFDVDSDEPVIRQPINRIMKRDVIHVRPDCSFHDAVKMLQEMNISCLPVTNGEKKIIGIATVTDVMRGLLAAYAVLEKAMA